MAAYWIVDIYHFSFMFSSKPATTNPQENVRDLISILSNDKNW